MSCTSRRDPEGRVEELGVTPMEFARQIEVPANRVSQIIAGKRSITGDTALRFGNWFGAEPAVLAEPAIAIRAGAG